MITRRKLLAFLGLGGAAAAVASKVEAAAETAAERYQRGRSELGEYEAFQRYLETDHAKAQIRAVEEAAAPMRYVTYEPPISDEERERLLEQLQRIDSAGAHVIPYAGPMLEDMPLIDLNDHRTPADFEHVALFAPEPEPRRLFGTVEGFGAVPGTAWVRIGVPGNARYICNEARCGKPVPHDAGDGCVLVRVWGES